MSVGVKEGLECLETIAINYTRRKEGNTLDLYRRVNKREQPTKGNKPTWLAKGTGSILAVSNNQVVDV